VVTVVVVGNISEVLDPENPIWFNKEEEE